ncbi:YgjV family protein [Romboutsia sp.]|uniref:YgjV family protein n=1 Tax=Romboutsia sp. TaxID=1965302 RepID=UPI002C9AD547|nr:YgjV family protein [Romboutsia sp.]HSQ88123.1 YgjV family protein [Romboutsia sp.]
MFNVAPIEWVGYAASISVAISLTMTNIVRLRIINSIGCLLFVIYGLYLGAYPVALANGIIVLINIYNLYKLQSSNKCKLSKGVVSK